MTMHPIMAQARRPIINRFGPLRTYIDDADLTDIDRAWRAVDACGGTYSAEELASGYAAGHKAALDAACAEIEKLGGRPS